jgi:hypothetical protein
MADITKADVATRFDFHPATPVTGPQHEHTRNEYRRVAETMQRTLPESREKSLAFTALEESLFWANAAIARNTE